MLARRITSTLLGHKRSLSTIPVNQVASVLKFNVGGEENAVKMDGHVATLNSLMKGHPGYHRATRYVCKSEWAYELSFIFNDIDSFKAWQDAPLRNEVHSKYLAALEDIGLKEDAIYGGARVHDELH